MNAMDPERTVTFRQGLPGFEDSRHFVLVRDPLFTPFTLIQGDGENTPSFVGIDPRAVDPEYQADLGHDDLARLSAQPGQALLWLALVTSSTSGRCTVNLRAPIVINPSSMQGIQVLAPDSPYRLDHPLTGA